MPTPLEIDTFLDDDHQTEVTILIYQHHYEEGQAPELGGHPDTEDQGHDSNAEIQSYHIKNGPPGKTELSDSELERLEKLIIQHYEEN
jgi:hypothetical protein